MSAQNRRSTIAITTAALIGGLSSVIGAGSVWALDITRCVSSDNHLYVVVRTTSDQVRVTSLAMSSGSANACCESPMAGAVLTALSAGGALLPNRMRTTVISGLPSNTVTCGANFNASAAGGQGQLTLPGGSTVSANGAFSSNLVVPVTTADGAVPAAFDVPAVARTVGGCMVSGETMAFPSTASVNTPSDPTLGEQASQTVTYDDTEGSTIGNRAPGNNVPPTQASPDGFQLEGDCTAPATCEVIVFIATQDGNIAASVAGGSFQVSASELTQSTECAASSILFNSPTPTATATQTATATETATSTETATATVTATASASATPTTSATGTAVSTATGTITGTPTHTVTGTPTHTGTPNPNICSMTPKAGCQNPSGPQKRRLRINAKRRLIVWKWRSDVTIPLADFGDPTTSTTYSLCIYTGPTQQFLLELRAPAAAICDGKPCWKPKGPGGSKGFRYRDHAKSNDGIGALKLRTKPMLLADLLVRAGGMGAPIPMLPLTEPVLAQMVKSDGPECWQTNYSSPAIKNNTTVYKDKND